MYQVGGIPQQTMPFAERSVDETDFALPEVAHPPVDQLGAAAGSPAGKVAALEQQRPVSAGRRVKSSRESSAPATDHDHVPGTQFRGPFEHVVSGEDVHLGDGGEGCREAGGMIRESS